MGITGLLKQIEAMKDRELAKRKAIKKMGLGEYMRGALENTARGMQDPMSVLNYTGLGMQIKSVGKTLFHGTGKDFEKFNNETIFATTNKEYAKAYTFKGDTPNIKTISSKVKNPIKLDEYADFKLTTTLSELTDVLESNGYKKIAKDLRNSEFKKIYPEGYEFEAWEILSTDAFKNIAMKRGYDGIIGTEGGHEIHAIFDPKNISIDKINDIPMGD